MPSIIDGLFSARAGIASHGTAIATLSDNISNANTTGFKASRADFADLLAGNLSGASGASVGSGSQVISTTQILNQGTLEFTGRGLDIAIDGNGFFMVQDVGGSGQTYYSRAGNMKIDPAGNLLNQNGFQLLGFPTGGAGGLEPLNVNERSSNSIQTNAVTIGGNLSADAPFTAGIPAAGSTFNAYNTASQFSTFVDVFDSLGGQHTVTNYFYHTTPNNWTVVAVVDGADTGVLPVPTSELGRVNLVFGADGLRTTVPVPPASDIPATPAWANGSSTTSPLDFTYDPFTQFSSPSAVTSITQDGTGGGAVIGFTVESNGNLFAQLDNGQTATIGTLALASFSNNEGLRRIGGSLYAESTDSGEPVVGRPNTGTLGALEAGALELSTADTAGDFIKLISLQRGFQGSARIITSINDLLNEIINLA